MKKKISLGKKLLLNKDMIATLDQNRQQAIQGGATADPGCVGSSHCTIIPCGPQTKDCVSEKC
ncbi:class I lanthipeptide [Taibaiella koreensis]|uniref:class I lanthipeptide n=1 Tax=Taibaiella koreensis TaxID=1268548 RepID=UPI000E59AE30|nr:class I lanthipeptide [Taibaiella koreensis]